MELTQTGNILNNTLGNISNLNFDKAFEVTSDPYFYIPIISLFVLTFLIYFI